MFSLGIRARAWFDLQWMAPFQQVQVSAHPIERFRSLLGDGFEEFASEARRARELFTGRVVWNVNSTAGGGGVAEMLRSHLSYVRATGMDIRWIVVGDGEEFFRTTKRIHNRLHEAPGDGGPLGGHERQVLSGGLAGDVRAMQPLVRAGDLVMLHDPQTLPLVEPMKNFGASVLWRSHVGTDRPGKLAREAWRFLLPYLERADGFSFSSRSYVWEGLDPKRVWIVPPSIDPFSPKNQEMEPANVAAALAAIGVAAGGNGLPATFTRPDGAPGRIDREAEMVQDAPVPPDVRLVTQVSRWDRLKGGEELLECFGASFAGSEEHLLLAGPAAAQVADDPEGGAVLAELTERRQALPADIRSRVHLAVLPLDDIDENAAAVNAIQRRSDVIVQNSLAEGFGLTVSEAMWKERPVVGTRVGGIQDQILDGETGLLIEPGDGEGLAGAIRSLLADPARARALGAAGRERVKDRFLVTGRLIDYLHIFESFVAGPPGETPHRPGTP